jgi:nucleotide-binding universal stress UspA family protein
MFRKILIATDFSPVSDCLIECAAELKPLGLKQAVLAHVVHVVNTRGLEDMFKAQAPSQFKTQKARLEEQGIEVETALEFGIPARDLNVLAEKHDVSAILIGSRGHNLVRSALGSVSFRLLQTAHRPVFLFRSQVMGTGESCQPAVCQESFRNILFATDFSDAAARAFDYIAEIAREFKPGVTLLHVFGTRHTGIELSDAGIKKQKDLEQGRIEEKKNLLVEMKSRLEAQGSSVEIEWATGMAAEEIVDRTAKGRFSLVVMGNHGKGFFREALLGSVANDVARHAEVPVLLIPSLHLEAVRLERKDPLGFPPNP